MFFPKFLCKGDTIGVTAPSFGAGTEPYISRFKEATNQFNSLGYKLKIGANCYKTDGLGISTNPKDAAKELLDFYADKETSAIISCGGGELMCETMSFIDFAKIAEAQPKWFMGYSDNTNFIFPLVTLCKTAAIYGHCITGFGKPLEQSELDTLSILEGKSLTVKGYPKFQLPETGTEAKIENPLSPYILNENKVLSVFVKGNNQKLEVKSHEQEIFKSFEQEISFSGMLLGGCLDVLNNLTGTKLDNMKSFNKETNGIIWVLESCDLNPMDIRRSIWHLDECGWFNTAKGFIIGRPLAAFRQEMLGVNTYNAVTDILSKYNVPIVMDADVGHIAPTMPLIMGSNANVTVCKNDITIEMQTN